MYQLTTGAHMSDATNSLVNVPNLMRIENTSKEDLQAHAMELTHAVYPHEEVYGQYCTLEEYVDCPPEDVFRYLADTRTLAEWTYSLRGFEPVSDDGLYVSYDKIGGKTRIYTRTVANQAAGTVDYHCAWDQGDQLWMIYLMRVIPAQLVLNRPGSVVTWTNCRHPFYDKNPRPELAPADRKVWVGDMWHFFFAGHHVEMQNLKHILEHRHRHGLAINPYEVVS
jgi:hypothetical protein